MSVQGYTSIMASVAALPETLTIVPMAMIFGIFAAKTGAYRWGLWLGWAMTAFGCGMLYLLDVGTPVVAWIFFMLGSGIGMGLLYPAMSLAIQASAPVEDAATVAGLFTFFRAFGQTVDVAIGSDPLDQALVTDQGFAICVRKVDPEKSEIDIKASGLGKAEMSAEQKVIDAGHSQNVFDGEEIVKVSEWFKSDLSGNRKSAMPNVSEELKLSARGKDTCPIFGKDY
ncbi:2e20ea53-fdf5-47d1-ace7-c16a4d3bb3b9 [Sclerotinia trifoliorum]|uniref:2e20ea53-fdf5-47d1-ace7-c16a4d3bb3b9 n=1 Tax=Sclerotinia trifoliorum TaxID=28548 RepID=A0A8H2ZRX4_9HELO|nr:2e20ea53-fdf5-47d1-ace7-c16a4d3bb3b9 [Sclerotinia trifoliorum]